MTYVNLKAKAKEGRTFTYPPRPPRKKKNIGRLTNALDSSKRNMEKVNLQSLPKT